MYELITAYLDWLTAGSRFELGFYYGALVYAAMDREQKS